MLFWESKKEKQNYLNLISNLKQTSDYDYIQTDLFSEKISTLQDYINFQKTNLLKTNILKYLNFGLTITGLSICYANEYILENPNDILNNIGIGSSLIGGLFSGIYFSKYKTDKNHITYLINKKSDLSNQKINLENKLKKEELKQFNL
jgi:hypothetical protein